MARYRFNKRKEKTLNINLTLVGKIIVLAAIAMGFIGYHLGKRKTHSPMLTAISLAVSCIIPLVALIYLIVLINKPDLPATASS